MGKGHKWRTLASMVETAQLESGRSKHEGLQGGACKDGRAVKRQSIHDKPVDL